MFVSKTEEYVGLLIISDINPLYTLTQLGRKIFGVKSSIKNSFIQGLF